MKTKYLIIGNGIAGYSAAKEIRNRDNKGSILMVSKEPYYTYYRIKLTENMYKDYTDEELMVAKEDWYADNNIEILLSQIVEKIDIEEKKVFLDDGRDIGYEKLLIATGSRPFIPPVAGKYKEGVIAIRTLNDIKYFKNKFKDFKDVILVGGGLLGLEAAWALKKIGKKVTIVEFAPYLLPRQLDEESSVKALKMLEDEGFKVYLGASTEEILGFNKVEGVRLSTGESIPAQGVIFSVGIRPEIGLIRDTGIRFDKGIIIDEYLRTNKEDIYAAGDCVEVNGMVVGLWTSSNQQGKLAGANMTGGEFKYIQARLFTTLKLGNINLFSSGNISDYDDIYHKSLKAGDEIKIFIKDDRIVGGILFGDLELMTNLNKAVEMHEDLDDFIKANKLNNN